MVDIFAASLGIISVFTLLGAVTRIILRPPKIWDQEDWVSGEIEGISDYDELRKENPHVWMD